MDLTSLLSDAPGEFLLLDAVTALDPETISGVKAFDHSPAWLGLESMAQLAALHLRHALDFSAHAFLLAVEDWAPGPPLDGSFRVTAVLEARSSRAAVYATRLYHGDASQTARLTIGSTAYDDRLRRDVLEPRYRRLLQWLRDHG